MPKPQIETELRSIEDKLRKRYSLLSKLFILIAILFTIFIVIVFLGITYLGYGYNWAGISLEGWIIALCSLFGVFIILELILYFHFSSAKTKRIDAEKPKIEFINGKRVHVFTFPNGKEGGIFSKTYIEIDKNCILRLRSLMIPPEELWGKK